MTNARLRYDRFGWDYELFNPTDEVALGWYLRHAQTSGGPVLELACGTGRLIAAFAEDGSETTGIDRSAAMLALARRRIERLNPIAGGRVRLHEADITQFKLGQQFRLIVIADNSFAELSNRDEQLACLRTAAGHLAPGGRVLISIRPFDVSRYPENRRQSGWSPPMYNPDSGETVRRKLDLHLNEAESIIRGVMTYECTGADGRREQIDCPVQRPILKLSDMHRLLRDSGFTAETITGFGASKAESTSQVVSFVCERG